MFQNKNQPPFRYDPEQFAPTNYQGPQNTLGRMAVYNHEQAASYDLTAGHMQDGFEWAEQLAQDKADPRLYGRVEKVAHVVMGKKFQSPEEVAVITQVAGLPRPIALYQDEVKIYEGKTAEELKNVREKLLGLDVEQHHTASRDLVYNNIPVWLADRWLLHNGEDIMKPSMPDTKPARKIIPITEWYASEATDEQLLSLLKWHTHMMEQRQKVPETVEAIDKVKQRFARQVADGIAAGWIRPEAGVSKEDVDDTEVIIGDVFDTLVHGKGGYHIYGNNAVVVAAGHSQDTTQKHINEYLPHELTHRHLGQLGGRALNEALTEHIRQSLEFGKPEIINPDDRENDSKIYFEERQMLHDLMDGIDPVLATLAFTGGQKELEDFEKALNDRWLIAGEEGVLNMVNRRIAVYEAICANAGMNERLSQARAVQEVSQDLKLQPFMVFAEKTKQQTFVKT